MSLHACINSNTVVEIVEVSSEEQYRALSSLYNCVLDISQLLIQPQVGWVLNGIILEPGQEQVIPLQAFLKSKIKHFQQLAEDLLVDMYVSNTMAGLTTADSDQLFDDYGDVILRIREGAWPTAYYRLSQKQPSGFVTQEMLDNWKNLILQAMV